MDAKTKKKLEILKLRRQGSAPGMFAGMNRARKFRNRKKIANKYKCRKKVEW